MSDIHRVRELFDRAAALPKADRIAYLTRVCGDDADLLAEVASLLACDDTQLDPIAASVAATAASHFDSARPWLGRRVGNYRIVEELGRGGMGSVYLAERADREYEHRVAIKVIRGFPSADALERLRRERQVLAGLVHPNIARLLDGGTTAEGQPFLVIEYIDGTTLPQWLTEKQPPLHERLTLFAQLCLAVHHAHQNLIVHRDLKPGNVMVRGDGTPVLLDFGIAKLIAPQSDGMPATAFRAFTEDYASPEQISGGPVTTASDVYALGLILYELLCREHYATAQRAQPWRLHRPSLVAAASQAAWLRRDARKIAGDLDHVVRRALASDPHERYSSAANFARDIERFLAQQPVEAGPDRLGYRLRKFVARHRAAVAASVIGLAGILAASVWLAIERNRATHAERRARTEAQTAEQVTGFLLNLFKGAAPENTRGRDITARELLDAGSASLDHALADQPAVRARLLAALGEIYGTIGYPQRSAEMLDRSIVLMRAQRSDPLRLAFALNESCRSLQQASDFQRAENACREALAIRQSHLPPNAPELGHTHEALGVVEQSRGDMSAAKNDYLSALEIFSHAGDAEREGLASAHHDLGFLAFHEGDNATALSEYRKAYDIKRSLFGDAHPSTLNSLNMIAQTEQALGDLDRARTDFENVLRLRVQVLGAESNAVAHTENDLGALLQDQGDFSAAEQHYRNAYALHAKLSPDSIDLATTANNLGTLYEDRGDFTAAAALFRESLEIRSRKFQPPHASLARAQHNLARCLFEMDRPDEARPLLDAALAARKQLKGVAAELFDSELLDIDLRLSRGDLAGAEQAMQELKPPQGAGHYRRRARYAWTQARAAAARGDWPAAREAAHEADVALAEKLAPTNPLRAQAALREAQYAMKAHDVKRAAELLRTALLVLQKQLAPIAPDRIAAEKLAAALGKDRPIAGRR